MIKAQNQNAKYMTDWDLFDIFSLDYRRRNFSNYRSIYVHKKSTKQERQLLPDGIVQTCQASLIVKRFKKEATYCSSHSGYSALMSHNICTSINPKAETRHIRLLLEHFLFLYCPQLPNLKLHFYVSYIFPVLLQPLKDMVRIPNHLTQFNF